MNNNLRSTFLLISLAAAAGSSVITTSAVAAPELGDTASIALAADPKIEREKARLQQQFESRYTAIRAAKGDGKIGETSRGFLEAVKGADVDRETSRLMDDDNRDRRELYKLIAEDEGVDADLVARRAAKRNFEKARKGEYLKRDSEWVRK